MLSSAQFDIGSISLCDIQVPVGESNLDTKAGLIKGVIVISREVKKKISKQRGYESEIRSRVTSSDRTPGLADQIGVHSPQFTKKRKHTAH